MADIEKIRRDMRAFAQVVDRRVQRGLQRAGDELASEARATVLRDRNPQRPLPSHLANSISLEQDESGHQVQVCANAPYARWVELGTRRIPARPFLRPAFAQVRSRIVDFLNGSGRGRP